MKGRSFHPPETQKKTQKNDNRTQKHNYKKNIKIELRSMCYHVSCRSTRLHILPDTRIRDLRPRFWLPPLPRSRITRPRGGFLSTLRQRSLVYPVHCRATTDRVYGRRARRSGGTQQRHRQDVQVNRTVGDSERNSS